jgi:predicted ester cyclase
VRLFLAAFPDLEVETNLIVSDGDLVAVNLTGRGTHERTFQGVPPTGRQWAATCSAFYRVTDGRIADSWVNWDLLAILEQVGGVRRAETASV